MLMILKWGRVNWKNFLLRDLFPILVAGKSKGLNHIEKLHNGISYLGATNQNNGVLCFVSRNESIIQKEIVSPLFVMMRVQWVIRYIKPKIS